VVAVVVFVLFGRLGLGALFGIVDYVERRINNHQDAVVLRKAYE
jgi:hypothetical protein